MNEHLRSLSESASIALADRVRHLKAQGVPVVGLQTGDPDFVTPAPIMEAAAASLHAGETHYVDSRGIPAYRQAVVERLKREHGLDYDPDTEILGTHGAVHAYYTGLQAIMTPGDSVLIPDPSWQTHANMVRVLRGEPILVPGRPDEGFVPTIEDWRAALRPNTKALVVNTPCNPTGAVLSREYLAELVAFAQEHDLWVISDEVYDSLLYDGAKHISAASIPGAKERTLLLNSLSKTYAMTGWRIGYLAAPKDVISTALKASQHSITNLAPFVQRAGAFALTDPVAQEAAAEMQRAYARRRSLVLDLHRAATDTAVRLFVPEGAFYFFIDMRAFGLDSVTIAERILTENGAALMPGVAYGSQGEGFLRMTIAASDAEVEAGFRAVLDWAAKQAANGS